MEPRAYLDFIVDFNLRVHSLKKDLDFGADSYLGQFGFGLIEESFELTTALDKDKPYEIGDCLAYYCLLAVSLGFSRDFVSKRLQDLKDSRQFVVESPVASLAGELKRLLRGDGSTSEVETAAYFLLTYCYTYAGVPFEAVATLNSQKLTDRLKRTGTLEGRGDKR
jgi:hypothetical protein